MHLLGFLGGHPGNLHDVDEDPSSLGIQAQSCYDLKPQAGSRGFWESEAAFVSIVSAPAESRYFHSSGNRIIECRVRQEYEGRAVHTE